MGTILVFTFEPTPLTCGLTSVGVLPVYYPSAASGYWYRYGASLRQLSGRIVNGPAIYAGCAIPSKEDYVLKGSQRSPE